MSFFPSPRLLDFSYFHVSFSPSPCLSICPSARVLPACLCPPVIYAFLFGFSSPRLTVLPSARLSVLPSPVSVRLPVFTSSPVYHLPSPPISVRALGVASDQPPTSLQVMVTNVTSLLKTVKVVEDEHNRGTRALEATVEALAQEMKAFDSADPPKNKVRGQRWMDGR